MTISDTVGATADAASPSRRKRWGLIVLITLVALVGIVYWALVTLVSGDVARGTVVRGMPIGDLTHEQAVSRLEAEFAASAGAPIPVRLGGGTATIVPDQAGLSVDWDGTVRQASGLVLSPIALVRHLTSQVPMEPLTEVDSARLDAAVAELADATDIAVEEPAIRFRDGKALLAPGVIGATLDPDGAAEVLVRRYFEPAGQRIPLPVTTTKPQVSDAAARVALTRVARPAVSRPVTVVARGTEIEVPAAAIAATLSFSPQGGRLVPAIDGKDLRLHISAQLTGVEREPRDAEVVISNGQPVVVPSQDGRRVLPDELAAAVLPVLGLKAADDRVAEVPVESRDPKLTTAQARELGITEQLSTFWQRFPPAAYRYQNVGRAAQYLNGTIIMPGETFSMNDTIHERTAANGYTKGFVISGGRFREEQGGGVSIITTATWTAGFYAGLERVESHAHGLYIDRYQAGLEATVAWGLLDLRMRNDTGNAVMITAQRGYDGVRISFWGTRNYDEVTASFSPRTGYTGFSTIVDSGEACVPSEGVMGFSIAVTRHLYRDGKEVARQTWPTRYKPTPHVVCR